MGNMRFLVIVCLLLAAVNHAELKPTQLNVNFQRSTSRERQIDIDLPIDIELPEDLEDFGECAVLFLKYKVCLVKNDNSNRKCSSEAVAYAACQVDEFDKLKRDVNRDFEEEEEEKRVQRSRDYEEEEEKRIQDYEEEEERRVRDYEEEEERRV